MDWLTILKQPLNWPYQGERSLFLERAEQAALQRANLIESGLYRLFRERHGLNGLAEIMEFMKTHVCEWHISPAMYEPIIERFRIDENYVAEFRMEWVKSTDSVSCRMSWIPYVYPIPVEGCGPWE